ncbi:MAG TPA: NADH-quinone oxidoreductase subunit M, partial [Stenomitos sp.]
AAIDTIPFGLQIGLLVILVAGFGIKTPLVPLHTWLPDAYTEASPPVAILLGGVLAKLGTYGLFRFGLGLLPQAWTALAPYLAAWAAIIVMYGALAAIAQHDIKRMVAYSSIGHMGYVLLGGAALTELSIVGAVSQMVAHGFILALLFYLVGIIEAKVGTRELSALNGLMSPVRGLPLTSALLVLGGMASAGIPGLVGFIAEFLVFQGSYAIFPWQTLLCVVGTGFTAVYFVILLNRTCFGRLDNKLAYYPKVAWSERIPALLLAVVILFLGVQPYWLVRWSEPTTAAMAKVAALYERPSQPTLPVLAQSWNDLTHYRPTLSARTPNAPQA